VAARLTQRPAVLAVRQRVNRTKQTTSTVGGPAARAGAAALTRELQPKGACHETEP